MIEYRKVILDASALIALLNEELGWQEVKNVIPKAIMSSINVAEVAKYLMTNKNMSTEHVKQVIDNLIAEIIPFADDQIYINAELVKSTSQYGLSLGDRACIALGMLTGYPIYTADNIWKNIQIENLNVKLIR